MLEIVDVIGEVAEEDIEDILDKLVANNQKVAKLIIFNSTQEAS